MSTLAISVVIPTYNRAAMVPRAVASALAAIGPEDEVIVVDDGSTDATPEALAPYQSRIQYLRLTNRGAGAARNAGVRAATRPLVAFLDSDDEWTADKLQMQRALMERRPDVLFCFTNFGVRSAAEEHRWYLQEWFEEPLEWEKRLGPGIPFSSLGVLPPGREEFLVYISDLYLGMLEQPYVLTTTLVVRREEAGAALHYPEDPASIEDWECFAQLARVGKGAYLNCETAWQWEHRNGRITDRDGDALTAARLAMLRRVWGADEEFLAQHGERFRAATAVAHRERLKLLILQGRLQESREEFARAEGWPLSYRMLLSLPVPVLRSLVTLRRGLQSRKR